MPRTAEQKAQTRRRILAETVRSLREGGARSVRVVQIMRDAGLTHGGFYAHFPSRDALVGEAIAQMTAESDVLQRLARHPGPPARALAEFLEQYLSTGHCERRPGACPLPILLHVSRTCWERSCAAWVAPRPAETPSACWPKLSG